MHKPESVLDNETHKILWDSEIQTDHLISTMSSDLEIINKKKRISRIVDFAVLENYRVKSKKEKIDKY